MSYPPENNIPAPPIFQDQKFQMSRFQPGESENNIPAPPIFQDQKFQMSRFQPGEPGPKIPNKHISTIP